jgi:hypothetical protein
VSQGSASLELSLLLRLQPGEQQAAVNVSTDSEARRRHGGVEGLSTYCSELQNVL